MATIKISELKPNKVLNRDIYYDGGPIFSKGDTITESQLNKLKDWGIEYGEIDEEIKDIEDLYKKEEEKAKQIAEVKEVALPDGSFIDPDKTTYSIKKSIKGADTLVKFDKNLEIIGNIEGGSRVEASGKIVLKGYVQDAVIICGEELVIEGGINGMSTTWIEAASLTSPYIREADIRVKDRVNTGEIKKSKVVASDSIDCTLYKGTIVDSTIEAGDRVAVKFLGNKEMTPVEIIIKNDKMKKWVSDFLELESIVREDLPKLKRLEKLIMVIKTMGEKIRTLPQDKKEQLALQSKLYFELKKKMEDAENKRKELDLKIRKRKAKGYCNVVVFNEIYPGVKIEIAGISHLVTSSVKQCGFYLKEGKILMQINPDLEVE
ncbi:MAG: FapA family protein [Candidatus Hydrogenedentota bacterium]